MFVCDKSLPQSKLTCLKLEAFQHEICQKIVPLDRDRLREFIGMDEILIEQLASELAGKGRIRSGEILLLAKPQAEMV